ncbi:VanW family protein [Desulfosporosinus sp. Sb-LF]|uniref:VanW family protein n=1 Tax=Desulfosporosinus sp. Sb-LF TaxID=2560027 RepID=UPI00107F6422|nr:VanW family protein [Desulfosporosinus sp. Sb-LF]TGE34024.1 vancomycin resistance protein [Desulfosporosinus sp. Sb-LF]
MRESEDQSAGHGEFQKPITKRWNGLKRILRTKSFYMTFGLLLITLVLVIAPLMFYTRDQHVIVEGVSISGINVGDLSLEQAKIAIDKETQRLMNQSVKLNVGQKSPEIRLEDLGLTVTSDLALQEAYDISRKGSFRNKVVTKMAAAKGMNFDLSQKWDDKKLKEKLNQTLNEFVKPAVDASFDVTNQNTMTIKSEHVGSVFDSEALSSQIKAINIYKPASEIKVEFKEQLPNLTAVQLEDQKITGLLASYTTRFDPSQIARSENVRIAAKALDMAVVKPGDTLSFNQIVGERTVDGGYKDAYIIVNGQFVPGLAGGICQVSSTLYNTGLLANLAVTQRSNHDLAISYVPLGQDATVAYPDLDLKFNNNTGGYLLVRSKSSANSVTIELYGKVKPGQEVFITNTTESIIPAEEQRLVDETLTHGVSIVKQHGQPGSIVKSIRTVKMNGKVVSSEPLKQSIYKALPTIIAVGG